MKYEVKVWLSNYLIIWLQGRGRGLQIHLLIRSGSCVLAGWVMVWEAWWAANPTGSLVSTVKIGAHGLTESEWGGTCFLRLWALVSRLLWVSCYPGQSLPLPVSLWLWRAHEKAVRMVVGWMLSFMDAFVHSCWHGGWCYWSIHPESSLLGVWMVRFRLPWLGQGERSWGHALRACLSYGRKREGIACGQKMTGDCLQ